MAEHELNVEEKRQLLDIARSAIAKRLGGDPPPQAGKLSPRLQQVCGAFVSLHKRGDLRGCIGSFTGRGPLADTVREMAISAALRDPRFSPLAADELPEVDLEISVLSPLREIDDPEEIEVGRHGIFITRDFYSGVLLPQVATEYGWDRQTFLEHTCLKAGLPRDAWQDPKTRIEVFEAQVFGEETTPV